MKYRFILYKINEGPVSGHQQITYVKDLKFMQTEFCSSPGAAKRMCLCVAYFFSLFHFSLHVKMVKTDKQEGDIT